MTRCEIERMKADLERKNRERRKIRERIRRAMENIGMAVTVLAFAALFCAAGGVEYGQMSIQAGLCVMGAAALVLLLQVIHLR